MQINLIKSIKDNHSLNIAVKILIGVLLLAVILSQVDYQKLSGAIRNSNISYLIYAFFAFGLSRFIEGVRLYVLISKHAFHFWFSIKLVVVSTFFNNVATIIAGDGYRIYSINTKVRNLNQSVAIIFFERSIGFIVIILIGLIYSIFNYHRLLSNLSAVSFQYQIPFKLFPIVLFVVISGAVIFLIFKKYYHMIFQQFHLFLENLLSTFSSLSYMGSFWIVGLSILAQLFMACKIYFLVLSFHHLNSLFDTLFIAVFIFIISFIPISVGSLGLREGALVAALIVYKVPVAEAVVISLIARAIMYTWALCGGLLYLSDRLKVVV